MPRLVSEEEVENAYRSAAECVQAYDVYQRCCRRLLDEWFKDTEHSEPSDDALAEMDAALRELSPRAGNLKTRVDPISRTIQRGSECFLKKSLDLRLTKLKRSEYSAFINII